MIEPGAKLRCVAAGRNWWLADGIIYTVKDVTPWKGAKFVELVEAPGVLWGMWRFEPVQVSE